MLPGAAFCPSVNFQRSVQGRPENFPERQKTTPGNISSSSNSRALPFEAYLLVDRNSQFDFR